MILPIWFMKELYRKSGDPERGKAAKPPVLLRYYKFESHAVDIEQLDAGIQR